MSSQSTETRDRVRALVREVLKTVPTEPDQPASAGGHSPEHVIVNSLKDKMEREFDRDESSKSLITEDDIRGLEPGSRLRVAENAKFTALAQDIVNEKKIELILKKARKVTSKVRSVAIGADHGGFEPQQAVQVGHHASRIELFLRRLLLHGIQLREGRSSAAL